MRTWSAGLQFEKIRLVLVDEWPNRWLLDSVPGTIFLRPGPLGAAGGLLRLTKDGMFLSLTADQIFSEELILWPGANPNFRGIRLKGTRVELVSK